MHFLSICRTGWLASLSLTHRFACQILASLCTRLSMLPTLNRGISTQFAYNLEIFQRHIFIILAINIFIIYPILHS